MPRLNDEWKAARKVGLGMQAVYLRRLRAVSGLTQSAVAKVLGEMEPTNYGHWESGRQFVHFEHQRALARLFSVDVAEFVLRMAVYSNPALRTVVGKAVVDAAVPADQRSCCVSKHPTAP